MVAHAGIDIQLRPVRLAFQPAPLRGEGGELAAQFSGGGNELGWQRGLPGVAGDHWKNQAMRRLHQAFAVIPFRLGNARADRCVVFSG